MQKICFYCDSKSTIKRGHLNRIQRWYCKSVRGVLVNIPKFIMQAILTGRKVRMQGSIPIYETSFNGTTHRIAVTIGNNGFVVGANMVSI